jgi:DNA-binding Lrp family transcriptional regulator
VGSSSPHAPTDSGCDPGIGPFEPSELERDLLDRFQRDFPLVPAPYAAIAEALGRSEAEVIACLRDLVARGCVSRVGAVFTPRRLGYSVLAALAVPQTRIEDVGARVSTFEEVNHNYEREHTYNLWFVVTARDRERVEEVLEAIEAETGIETLRLPLERSYHIDLGFPLWR